ncbi:hypothetical protein BJ684DRAFT_21382 [Piptocephalis cylindrospora]|uniref:Uncharacterized protein n=1 Tax=Piptocephalis cylindrospora TaxID=1907219 RepID=A0A4P9XZY2_9FUNG|nr:hypothetical protein BJ684DRAFT_21382 [Piptocephalis cylindrospora]|eukprot:RKP12053.1 hypothetical protein BJ684DRAFT_21382 [Piptocephalis cylindrospora]
MSSLTVGPRLLILAGMVVLLIHTLDTVIIWGQAQTEEEGAFFPPPESPVASTGGSAATSVATIVGSVVAVVGLVGLLTVSAYAYKKRQSPHDPRGQEEEGRAKAKMKGQDEFSDHPSLSLVLHPSTLPPSPKPVKVSGSTSTSSKRFTMPVSPAPSLGLSPLGTDTFPAIDLFQLPSSLVHDGPLPSSTDQKAMAKDRRERRSSGLPARMTRARSTGNPPRGPKSEWAQEVLGTMEEARKSARQSVVVEWKRKTMHF